MRYCQFENSDQIVADLLGVLSGLAAGSVFGSFVDADVKRRYTFDCNGIFYRDILSYAKRIVAKKISVDDVSRLLAILLVLRRKHVAVLNYLHECEIIGAYVNTARFYSFLYLDDYVESLFKNLSKYGEVNKSFSLSEYIYIDSLEDDESFFIKFPTFFESHQQSLTGYKKYLSEEGIAFKKNAIPDQIYHHFCQFNSLLSNFVRVIDSCEHFGLAIRDVFNDTKPIQRLYQCIEKIFHTYTLQDENKSQFNALVQLFFIELGSYLNGNTIFEIYLFCEKIAALLPSVSPRFPDEADLVRELASVQSIWSSPFKDVCVVPTAMQGVFGAGYDDRIHASQEKHRLAVNVILSYIDKKKWPVAEWKAVNAGEAFCSFMFSVASMYYNRFQNFQQGKRYPVVQDPGSVLSDEKLTRTHFPLNIDGYSKRGLFNMVAVAGMQQRLHENGPCEITLKNFIERTNRYFHLNLTITSSMPVEENTTIAFIGGYKTGPVHFLGCFFRLDKFFHFDRGEIHLPGILVDLYSQLLQKIFDEKQDRQLKINAIFCLVFLYGSNPFLIQGQGGGFQTDALFALLLHAIGEKPIRKNFLNLTEIFLLLCFAEDKKASWEKPYSLYEGACRGETNLLFHPIGASVAALLKTLPASADLKEIWPDYDNVKKVLISKIVPCVDPADAAFQAYIRETSIDTPSLPRFFHEPPKSSSQDAAASAVEKKLDK